MKTSTVLDYSLPVDSRSAPRKQIDASFGWIKDDGYAAEIDLMSFVNSSPLFYRAYGLYDSVFPSIPEKRIKRYLEKLDLPDTAKGDLIDERKSCYSNIESVVFVRSLGKDTWKGGNYNRVTINNLVREDDSTERRRKSIMNIKVTCSCIRSTFARSCRASALQRRIFRDYRKFEDLPGVFVDTVFCKHACVAMHWISTFDYGASFGLFGIRGERGIDVSKDVINDILDYKARKGIDIARMPHCDINNTLNRRPVDNWGTYLSYWTEPLRELIFPLT